MGFATPGVAEKFRLYDRYLAKMETTLATQPWLAGQDFTLADVAMTPYLNRLDMMGMSEMWTRSRPRVTGWWGRICARPTFKTTFLDACPPDLTADLKTFGSQSWPEVKKILGI